MNTDDPDLDADVVELIEEDATNRGVPFRRALNDLVRAGRKGTVPTQASGEIRRTRTFHLGDTPIAGTDCYGEMMEILEGPLWR